MEQTLDLIIQSNSIKFLTDQEILILGCGAPSQYFPLLNSHSFKKVTFVDIEPINNAIDSSMASGYGIKDHLLYAYWEELERIRRKPLPQYYELFTLYLKSKEIDLKLNYQEFTGSVRFEQSDIRDFIELEVPHRYDVIIISKVLSHLSYETKKKSWILDNIVNLMKPSGKLFLRVNGKYYPILVGRDADSNSRPLRFYTIEDVAELTKHMIIAEGPFSIDVSVFDSNAVEYWYVFKT